MPLNGTVGSGAAFSKASEQVVELHSDLLDRIMPECTVPAILLPTGPKPADFTCAFDFHNAVDALRRGRLVRPRIEAWAGRSDLDRIRLGAVLRDQFSSQFRAQKLALAQTSDPAAALQAGRIQHLEKARDSAGSRLETSFKVAATAIGAALLVANPIADLLFLTLALFGGSSAVTGLFQQLRATSDLRAAESALERSREQVERDLDVSSGRFQEAVANITVHVHPVLQRMVSGICELEGQVLFPEAAEYGSPDVGSLLTSSEYVEALDPSYRPFIGLPA